MNIVKAEKLEDLTLERKMMMMMMMVVVVVVVVVMMMVVVVVVVVVVVMVVVVMVVVVVVVLVVVVVVVMVVLVVVVMEWVSVLQWRWCWFCGGFGIGVVVFVVAAVVGGGGGAAAAAEKSIRNLTCLIVELFIATRQTISTSRHKIMNDIILSICREIRQIGFIIFPGNR
jgi:hypothetical protein